MANKVYKYELDDLLPFKKYKGETIEDIIDFDPEYIDWLTKNVSWFGLTDEALEALAKSFEELKELNEIPSLKRAPGFSKNLIESCPYYYHGYNE